MWSLLVVWLLSQEELSSYLDILFPGPVFKLATILPVVNACFLKKKMHIDGETVASAL